MTYLWLNTTQVVSGDDSLRIISPSIHNTNTLIRCAEPGDLKWVLLGLPLTSEMEISEITLYYQSSIPGLSITQVRLSQMEQPGRSLVVHDDNAIAYSPPSATSYTSLISPPIRAENALTLEIRLNCESTDGELILGAVRLDISERPTDKTVVDCGSHYSLSEFGNYQTLPEAEVAFESAIAHILNNGGGQLCIPQDAPARFTPRNRQQLNNPFYGLAAGEIPTRQPTVGVTIVNRRNGFERTYLPPAGSPESETLFGNASQILERTLSQNLPSMGSFKTQAILSRYLGGGSSYMLSLLQPVSEGSSQRFYIPTHRGLFPGQELVIYGYFYAKVQTLGIDHNGYYFVSETLFGNASQILERTLSQNLPSMGSFKTQAILSRYLGGGSSYMLSLLQPVSEGSSQRFYIPTHRGLFPGQELVIYGYFYAKVQTLGIDHNGYYFVADASKDVPIGVGVYNKNILGGLLIADTANCDNQSPSLTIKRDTYGTGDTFGIWNEMNYQGNIMSGGGDEGGVGVASELIHDLACFWGSVEHWDADNRELTYQSSSTADPEESPLNPHKLGTSRPLINMTPSRWRTEGQVMIVGAGFDYLRTGPLQEDPNKTRLSSTLIIGDKSVQWDERVVGQFFTVDDPTEYYQEEEDYYHADGGKASQPIRRWWHITHFEKRDDGRFNLYVEQVWWGNTDVIKGGPSLFRIDNFTFNADTEKRLNYIIAPGAWVADVREAVAVPSAGKVGLAEKSVKRVIELAPATGEQAAEKALFQTGDRITNAPGPQPWNPTGFRSRHFAGFPTLLSNASFSSYNTSRVQVSAGLSIADAHTGKSLDQVIERQKDRQPAFKAGIRLSASTQFGLFMDGPFQQAAIDITTGPHALSDARSFPENKVPFKQV